MADADPEPPQPEVKDEDLDAGIDAELVPDATDAAVAAPPDPMNLDGGGDANPADDNPAAANGLATTAAAVDPNAPVGIEARIPAKKESSLREFVGRMDEFAPVIPDAVTNYYLTLAGLPPPPHTSPHLARLLALATQKFVADIAADAYQYSRIRSTNTTSNNPMGGLGGAAGFGVGAGGAPGGAAAGGGGGAAGQQAKDAASKAANLGVPRAGFGGGGQGGSQGRTVLTMEDLGMAVSEYGVNVKRGEFYR